MESVTEARVRELIQQAFGIYDQRFAEVMQQADGTIEQIKTDAQQLRTVLVGMHTEIEDHKEKFEGVGASVP